MDFPERHRNAREHITNTTAQDSAFSWPRPGVRSADALATVLVVDRASEEGIGNETAERLRIPPGSRPTLWDSETRNASRNGLGRGIACRFGLRAGQRGTARSTRLLRNFRLSHSTSQFADFVKPRTGRTTIALQTRQAALPDSSTHSIFFIICVLSVVAHFCEIIFYTRAVGQSDHTHMGNLP